MTVNDLTSSWAKIIADWRRPSPSPFLQIYPKVSSVRTTLQNHSLDSQHSSSPVLQEFDVDATGAQNLDLKSMSQDATKHSLSSKLSPGQRECVVLSEVDEDGFEEIMGGRMTRFRSPDPVFSGQNSVEGIQDKSPLVLGSIPSLAQDKKHKKQVQDVIQARKAKDLTGAGLVNLELTHFGQGTPIDRVSAPSNAERTSGLKTSNEHFQELPTVGLVEDDASTSHLSKLDLEPPNASRQLADDRFSKLNTLTEVPKVNNGCGAGRDIKVTTGRVGREEGMPKIEILEQEEDLLGQNVEGDRTNCNGTPLQEDETLPVASRILPENENIIDSQTDTAFDTLDQTTRSPLFLSHASLLFPRQCFVSVGPFPSRTKRRRIKNSKSQSLRHPSEREVLECIIVRNDFENVYPVAEQWVTVGTTEKKLT